MFNTIDEALHDLRQGRIVIVCDDEDRENEGDFTLLLSGQPLKASIFS